MQQPGERPLRILHAPRNIAGQAGDTVAALRRLGHDAELWEDSPDPFGRPSDRVLALDRDDPRPSLAAMAEAAERFDIVHFHFGQTLVPRWGVLPPFWDLPVLRGLGLRVFFTFHGTDVRLDRVHRSLNPWAGDFTASGPPEDDRTEKAVQVMRTYADALFVVSVNYLAYVPDAVYMPRVIDLGAWPDVPARSRERPVVVHAPTRRGTKGTELLLPVLDELRLEGLDFDLRLVEGAPHDEVRSALADADLLVDNLVAGSYGIVALEAMASGAAVVSNMSAALRAAHPDAPVVPVDPTTIKATLRRLMLDPAGRREIAARGRPFVAATHDADLVAARLVEAYRAPAGPRRNRAMPDWMSMAPARRIETLEAQVARLEANLAAASRREAELRAALGRDDGIPPSLARRTARRVVPETVRRRLGG
jgi:glycosyltransferase involved in cell wall biosynthesis